MSTFRVDAMAAACPDPQELQDPLDFPESQESQEPPVCPVCPEHHQPHHASPLLHHHANHAQLDPPAHLDPQDPQETQVSLEPLADQDLMPHQDPPDPKDPQEPQESQAQMDHKEMPVFPLRANPFKLVTQDHQEMLAHKDPQAPLDSPVEMDSPAQLDPKDPKDPKDQPVETVFQAHKDPPALQAHRESVVFAPNIAPWTVESSSRTEHDDKLIEPEPQYRDILFETVPSLFVLNVTHPWLLVFLIAFGQSVTSQFFESQSRSHVERFSAVLCWVLDGSSAHGCNLHTF